MDNNKDPKIEIDQLALINELMNPILNNFIVNQIQADDKVKGQTMKLLRTANKYGVSTDTMIKILSESLMVNDENEDEDDSDYIPY